MLRPQFARPFESIVVKSRRDATAATRSELAGSDTQWLIAELLAEFTLMSTFDDLAPWGLRVHVFA